MKTAWFDCFSGISGDMTLAAMIDAGLSPVKLRRELKKLGVDGYSLSVSKTKKCGIAATRVKVKLAKTAHKTHRHYPDIVRLIKKSGLEPPVKKRALKIFEAIAQAEAAVHGVPMNKVHFHEVGAVDSIVDIVGAAIGFEELGIGKIVASPVNTGSGTVNTEHGILPVPAPATALLLQGIPTYADGPRRELTTPTGAAIVKAMAERFGAQPMMTVEAVGNGAGGHDFPDRPNILRLFIGEERAAVKSERLIELNTNIDDMNPQSLAAVSQKLFAAGALDVTIIPVQMKKGRPGVILSVLTEPALSAALEALIFENTSTLGLRRNEVERISLPREIKRVKTRFGPIEVKIAVLPEGGSKAAPEFESVKKAADKNNSPFDTVYQAALYAWSKNK